MQPFFVILTNVYESDAATPPIQYLCRENLPSLLEEPRPYLQRTADREVPPYLLSRFDSSDVVQETMGRAILQLAKLMNKGE